MAIYLGAAGLALCGQFISLMSILVVLAGGGISYGIIKYVAEYAYSETKLKLFLYNVVAYTCMFSMPAMVLGILLRKQIAVWILGSEQYADIIVGLSVAQVFLAFNLVLSSVLSGFKRLRLLTLINIISAFVGLMIAFVLIKAYGIEGGLFSLIISQLCPLFFSILFLYREKWFHYLRKLRVSKKIFAKLLNFSWMNMVSVLTVPIAQILVRDDISSLYSWQAVGYWQAVLRLSDAYLLIVTIALTTYYLPRLSELKNNRLIWQEMKRAYQCILPLIVVATMVIYFFRDFIIMLLYSQEFTSARDLFLYQFTGDFFRIAGWLSTYLLLAKAWAKTYIATEIFLSALFVIISYFMVRSYGLVGVTYAFAITYAIYWVVMSATSILYFKKAGNICLPVKNL